MEKQISKKCSLMIGLVTLAVILLGLFSGFAFRPAMAGIRFYESQITSDPASQVNPDIYGDIIVYQDNRNGNWDIYMVKYGYGETRITTHTANQINPRISGDKIVYQDDRNGNWDIYLYDLSTQTETQITNNPFAQEYPAIDGNRIVWQHSIGSFWQIHMYDLTTHTESSVAVGENPEISGNRIVYNWQGVECLDLSSGSTTRLSSTVTYPPLQPPFYKTFGAGPNDYAISGSHIVFSVENYVNLNQPPLLPDISYWEWDIYMRDVVTGATWDTCGYPNANGENRRYPHISELYTGVYYIVYQRPAGGYWNIYLYHTDLQTEYRVTNVAANQAYPRVSGGRIVYMDNRNGNWDIYMTTVGYKVFTPPPPTPAAAIQEIQGIQSIIADPAQIPTSDLDGANSKVKENRRKALLKKLDAVIASIQAAADATHPASRRAKYQRAINQLNSILDKTDGCALRGTPDKTGTGFRPDWMITCESQELIDPLIRSSITILQALLE